jgi:hypothetical protein
MDKLLELLRKQTQAPVGGSCNADIAWLQSAGYTAGSTAPPHVPK